MSDHDDATCRRELTLMLRRLTDAADRYLTTSDSSPERAAALRNDLWDIREESYDCLGVFGWSGSRDGSQAVSEARSPREDLIAAGREMAEHWISIFRTVTPILSEMTEGYVAALREAFPPKVEQDEPVEEEAPTASSGPWTPPGMGVVVYGVPAGEINYMAVACGWSLGHQNRCGNWRPVRGGHHLRVEPGNAQHRLYVVEIRAGEVLKVPYCGLTYDPADITCGHELRSYEDAGDVVRLFCGKPAGHSFAGHPRNDRGHGDWTETVS